MHSTVYLSLTLTKKIDGRATEATELHAVVVVASIFVLETHDEREVLDVAFNGQLVVQLDVRLVHNDAHLRVG